MEAGGAGERRARVADGRGGATGGARGSLQLHAARSQLTSHLSQPRRPVTADVTSRAVHREPRSDAPFGSFSFTLTYNVTLRPVRAVILIIANVQQ